MSGLNKLAGTPCNLSAGTGGIASNDSEAAKRPQVDSSINSGKFTGASRATSYGTAGVSGKK